MEESFRESPRLLDVAQPSSSTTFVDACLIVSKMLRCVIVVRATNRSANSQESPGVAAVISPYEDNVMLPFPIAHSVFIATLIGIRYDRSTVQCDRDNLSKRDVRQATRTVRRHWLHRRPLQSRSCIYISPLNALWLELFSFYIMRFVRLARRFGRWCCLTRTALAPKVYRHGVCCCNLAVQPDTR
jgi:hypothetical protein